MTAWLIVGAVVGAAALAARFTFWRRNIPGLPVLMYHYLSEDVPGEAIPKLRVRPRDFERQMDYLAENGYQTIGFEDWRAHVDDGKELPNQPVIVTFDDGGRDCLLARDIMAARGLTGVVYPVTDLIGRWNEWDEAKNQPRVDLMTWDELGELADSGWEIGSHGRRHRDLTGLADDELTGELAESKQVLEERLGRPVVSFAYPYGRENDRVQNAVRVAGYRFGLSTRHGKNQAADDPYGLRRLIVKRKDTIWDLALKLKKGRSTL